MEKRIAYLKKLHEMKLDETFDSLPKKKLLNSKLKWKKLDKNLGGIKRYACIPKCTFCCRS